MTDEPPLPFHMREIPKPRGKMRTMQHISRGIVKQYAKDTVFVFGDNIIEKGFGGQAAEMRGEPNAIGIPTKWKPNWEELSFFTDGDLDRPVVKDAIDKALAKIEEALASGKNVVISSSGVGSHRADLQGRAPRIDAYIKAGLAKLAGE